MLIFLKLSNDVYLFSVSQITHHFRAIATDSYHLDAFMNSVSSEKFLMVDDDETHSSIRDNAKHLPYNIIAT